MKVNYPETILNSSKGTTSSEAYLSRLCNDTFLSLWSYSNPYTDEGQKKTDDNKGIGNGKELCDLLVIFENHIFIFSDKHCKFPISDNIQIGWSRWYKRAIKNSSKQIYGAEKFLLDYPNRIFLNKECTQSFPIEIPKKQNAIIHRIIVAHGSRDACVNFFNGGSGSLMLNTAILGDEHMKSSTPFNIGQINPSKGYIHVFDDITLEIIMKTLDTISDFTMYIERKEKFIDSGKDMIIPGEEDLLAWYLQRIDNSGQHTFLLEAEKDITAISIEEGMWNEFKNSNTRKDQLKANEISYLWDRLIESFLLNIFAGTSYYMSHPKLAEQEKIFRFLAKTNRTQRRILAESIYNLLSATPENFRATRIIPPLYNGDPFYLFFLLPKEDSIDYADYRDIRKMMLMDYLKILKHDFPNANYIIGIATETGISENRSEDIAYLDASNWTENDEIDSIDTKEFYTEKGLINERDFYKVNAKEYPQKNKGTVINKVKGRDRNMNCPCGSGKNFKRCCGKRVI